MGILSKNLKIHIIKLIIYWLCCIIMLACCRIDATKSNIANFVFGDSLVDVGNNNYLVTFSKANYVPNGIDFGMPTGRYTNGRTIIDLIVEQFGLGEYTPPYLAPSTRGSVILKGVNYASGGGGILNATGSIFGGRLNFDAQLDNFANTKEDMINNIGEEATTKLLSKALFTVTMGSNDFINNYLTPIFSKLEQALITPEAFVSAMISRYRLQVTRLYNLGARKIVLVNVGPIGCIPYERDMNPLAGDDCVALPNQLAELFNLQLKSLTTELSSTLKEAKWVYADAHRIFIDIIVNYQSYGFGNANSACCYAGGRFGGLIPCGPTSNYCSDRSKYVFWDPYHPSDAANVIVAKRLIDGDINDISPINIRQLLSS